jgi:hypothetical protein
METLASSEIFLFEDFRLDRRGGGLFRRDDDGAFTAVAIGSRGLDILGAWIERADVQPIGLTRRLSPPGSKARIVGARYLQNENICQAEARSGVNRAG